MLKHILLTLLLFSVASFSSNALFAQTELSKEEIKIWKKKAQDYRRNLASLKQLEDEHTAYQNQVLSLQQQLVEAQNQLGMKDRQVAAFEAQQADLNQRVIEAEARARENTAPTTTAPQPVYTNTTPSVSGTIFRVQIGAFQVNKMDADLATGGSMLIDEAADGLQKIQVGEFRSYADAIRLRNQLRKTGVKDAFVVAAQDGQPIPVETAVQATGERME